jgi:hypothetical protein
VQRSLEEMTQVTSDNPTGGNQDGPLQQEPETPELIDEPGYLTTTGEAVGDDGSVVPIVGGLPAAAGSAWDIGEAAEDRGVLPADEQGPLSDQDTPGR